MKKEYCISWLLSGAAAIFLIMQTAASAADRVVVIPLFSGTPTVVSAGQVWMDRNLDALRRATKNDDPDAYGSLYQWGRLTDGHEYRASPTISTLSFDDVPGHGDFITVSDSPYDWRNGQNNNLWQGASDDNNPCPAGFRLPTETEWETERLSWGSNDAAGAFASPLELVVAGYRSRSNGTVYAAGSKGYYWSSTVSGIHAKTLYFDSGNAYMSGSFRAHGDSVRCIKD